MYLNRAIILWYYCRRMRLSAYSADNTSKKNHHSQGGKSMWYLFLWGQNFIGIQLIYNVVLVSVIYQSESVIYIYIYICTLFQIIFPYKPLQSFCRVPCAIEQVLIYIIDGILHTSIPVSQVIPPPLINDYLLTLNVILKFLLPIPLTATLFHFLC